MSTIQLARELLAEAKAATNRMAVAELTSLPGRYDTFARMINTVSCNKASIRKYRGKVVVIDLSWIAD